MYCFCDSTWMYCLVNKNISLDMFNELKFYSKIIVIFLIIFNFCGSCLNGNCDNDGITFSRFHFVLKKDNIDRFFAELLDLITIESWTYLNLRHSWCMNLMHVFIYNIFLPSFSYIVKTWVKWIKLLLPLDLDNIDSQQVGTIWIVGKTLIQLLSVLCIGNTHSKFKDHKCKNLSGLLSTGKNIQAFSSI
jgi:hypothetical protein